MDFLSVFTGGRSMGNLLDNETVHYRLKYVLQIDSNDKTIAQAAREAKVAWRTMKIWYDNFKNDGVVGLSNKPRGRSQPVDEEVKKKIKEYKVFNRSRSGRKIRDLLRKNDGIIVNRQTVWRLLKEAGENKRVKRDMKVYHDFERQHPNSLWQTDYMDAIVVEGVGLVYLVLYLDDHSRHIIGGKFEKDRTAYRALSLLRNSVTEKGLPLQVYCDQGKQFK
ncbi:MAG: DDE-type integrase/transposase/recombinase, partial [Candidatus Lokiarchaeota archaeon]|nr:DDE-type integrase/transposase/recombinase [Candidatus Lokiarchaeota archaeon]